MIQLTEQEITKIIKDAHVQGQCFAPNIDYENAANYAQEIVKTLTIPVVSKRYFVVGFLGATPKGQAEGTINMLSDGGYLNRAIATRVVEQHNKGITNVVISSVIELSKADYDAWVE